MTTQTKVDLRKTMGTSESADIVKQKTSSNCSPAIKKALEDQEGKTCLTAGPTAYEAKRYPTTKRRPLQRQKSSGIADFEQYFALPSHNEEIQSTSVLCKRTMLPEDSEAGPSSSRLSQTRGIRNTTESSHSQQDSSVFSHQSSDASNFGFSNSPMSRPCEIVSRKTMKTMRPHSHKQTGHYINESKVSLKDPASVGPVEMRTHLDFQYIEDQAETKHSRSPPQNVNKLPTQEFVSSQKSTTAVQRHPSDGQSFIQYRRVKARRNSSTSQADLGATVAGYLLPQFPSRPLASEVAPLAHQEFFPTEAYPPVEERSDVNKHVESWLDETVNITRLKKSRRGNFSHLSSGDAAYEAMVMTSPVVTQPHSFDVPATFDSFDSHYGYYLHSHQSPGHDLVTSNVPRPLTTANLQHVAPVFRKLSESPHFIVPSLTVDSNDSCQPDLIGGSQEERHFVSLLSLDKKQLDYRRNSDNPTSHLVYASHLKTNAPTTPLTPDGVFTSNAIDPPRIQSVGGCSLVDSLLQSQVDRERASTFQFPEYKRTHLMAVDEFANGYNQENELENRAKVALVRQSRSFSSPRHVDHCSPKIRMSKQGTEQHLMENDHLRPRRSNQSTPRGSHSSGHEIPQSMHSALCSTGQVPRCQHASFPWGFRGGLSAEVAPVHQENVLLSYPVSSNLFERRYSHHLKPLDAWQNRQSHSMEVVNTNSFHCKSTDNQCLISRAAQKHMPVMYSRSVQQSTCSFPTPWIGFLSGPELSLTSTFDSTNSVTPDSQKNKMFFDPLNPSERRATRARLTRPFHVHSASESPVYPHSPNALNETFLKLKQSELARYSKHNILQSPHIFEERNVERKVKSFELNLSFDPSSDLRRQSHLTLPTHYSSSSSRRGSALDSNPKRSFTGGDADNRVIDIFERQLLSQPKPIDKTLAPSSQNKLIPPDLIFSPASRRASLLEESEPGVSEDANILGKVQNTNPVNSTFLPRRIHQQVENHFTASASDRVRSPYHGRRTDRELHLSKGPEFQSVQLSPHSWWRRHFQSPQETRVIPGYLRLQNNQQDFHHYGQLCSNMRQTPRALSDTPSVEYISVGVPRSPINQHISRRYLPARRSSFLNDLPCKLEKQSSISLDREQSTQSTGSHILDFEKDVISRDKRKCKETSQRIVKNHRHDLEGTSPKFSKCGIIQHENYLFRSTSTGESSIDPQILQPSLRPVMDSSEENITDRDEDVDPERGVDLRNPKECDRQLSDHPSISGTMKVSPKRLVSEQQEARRRSFVARFWQKTVHHSEDTSSTSFEVVRNDGES
ncbi:hypothetical protein EG68_01001 [Paragonimus skrjabini miyazakii]|uniref:Uncharacterized protein n=1 Tax=Paragonimus skrjabini miyazakii TaxID=59628 RepID=A0A8S9Z4D1_9TREM|nr:hypothetical protein EG68_01001 [Paragonimus skrjabini miyazakii]